MTVKVFSKGERIFVQSSFALKEVAKSIPGAEWDKAARLWSYPSSPDSAFAIRRAYDDCHPPQSIAVDIDVLRLLRDSEAQQPSRMIKQVVDLPRIPGRYCKCETPKPGELKRGTNPYMCESCGSPLSDMRHQREAYAFLSGIDGVAGMGMGTGKTKLYIALLDGAEADISVIVTTKKGRRVFPKQFEMHSDRPWTVMNGVRNRKGELIKTAPLSKYVDQAAEQLEYARRMGTPFALVVHYDVIWRDPMREFIMDLLKEQKVTMIYDESHRIKSPGGKASKQAALFRKHAERVYLGTGSFMAHSKLDVYGQLRACRPTLFGTNFNRFKYRYGVYGGFENRELIAWQNQEEFNEYLSRCVFMVDTDDVLDLPETVDIVREVELGTKARKLLKQLEAELLAEMEEGSVTASNALTKILRQQQITSGYAVLDREDEGEDAEVVQVDTAKRDDLKEILEDLPPDEQVVVFCRFTADLQNVREVAEECNRAYGEVSGSAEDLTPDATIPDHVNVLGVQVQSGSEAVDFTASRYNVYYSIGHSLKDFLQSKRRSHRPGQVHRVTRFHLVAVDTIDEQVYDALAVREREIQVVVDHVKGAVTV